MPPPPGMELGPEPPPAPRKLPSGYAFRERFTGNLVTIIGLAFTAVGCIMALAMLAAPGWALCIPGLMLLGGLSVLKNGIQSANRVLDAFRHGRAVKGRAASVQQDRSTSVNGQHPWQIVYTFESGGHAYEGKTQSWESATAMRFYGNPPVWVLVVENQPERNTLYPPVK
jgi:hypothetical protein